MLPTPCKWDGRGFNYRRMVIAETAEAAATALSSRESQSVFSGECTPVNPPVTFMFPGQGSQYVNMGRGLYDNQPIFREWVDRACELLLPHLGLDLRTLLYPEPHAETVATEQLAQTQFTQPALFVIEYATAQLWQSWGIQPTAAIGHSIGEYVAACLAGVFSFEDALALVAVRGRLMQQLPGGSMLAVCLSGGGSAIAPGGQPFPSNHQQSLSVRGFRQDRGDRPIGTTTHRNRRHLSPPAYFSCLPFPDDGTDFR